MLATKKIFWISLDKGFKKQKRGFLFSGISSDVLLISFYVSLFIFEDIICWIARVTFRWILVLFSFCLNSHNTNYVFKECKKRAQNKLGLFPCYASKFLQIDFVLLIRTLHMHIKSWGNNCFTVTLAPLP